MASSSRDDARGALDCITSCLGGGPSPHFESVCYHPLFVFNQDGDCLAATLRPGNVHSADGWDTVLLPVIDRYRTRGQTLVVRADAAFALPTLYEALGDGVWRMPSASRPTMSWSGPSRTFSPGHARWCATPRWCATGAFSIGPRLGTGLGG